MTKKVVIFVVLFLFCILFSSINSASSLEDVENLEAFIDGIFVNQLDSSNINGATISIVKDGEIILNKGYGYADLEQKVPVNPDTTIFRPG